MKENIDPQLYGVTKSLFLEWRSPRLGKTNPTIIKSKVWEWLFCSKLSGYAVTQKFNGPSPFDEGPTYSFDRFGQSVTELPDGRVIYIGGEHEDHYDPDFYIYNDVVVVNPNKSIDFFCYSKSDFLPTDFHSASLINNKVVIIGSLGYPEDRAKDTQIYLLDLESYEIQKINASGQSPGWIHNHNASLSSDNQSIIIKNGKVDLGKESSLRENIDEWELKLAYWHWKRITKRNWTRWEIKRHDKNCNHLWEIRQALWTLEMNWKEDHEKDIEKLESELGYIPDVKNINGLYSFELEHEDLQEGDEEHNVFWIYINGIRVRFVEEHHCLQVTVEGELADETIQVLKKDLLTKISKLENAECDIESY